MTNTNHHEDMENQLVTIEQYNLLLKFEKIYETNFEKITWLETAMKYLQVIAILTGLCFLVFFSIFMLNNNLFSYSWILTLVTFIIGVLALTLTINFFLNLTVIYNEGTSLASWMSYFSVNLSAINLAIFALCFFLKLQGYITVQWKIITIPLYIIIGISLFYFIFMLPAFIDKESYWDIMIISSLIFNALAFLILLNSRLDRTYKFSFFTIFIPLWILNACFFLYIIYSFVTQRDKSSNVTNILNLIVNTSVTIASILAVLNLDKMYITPPLLSFLLIIFSYTVFFTDRFLAQFEVFLVENPEKLDKQEKADKA